MRKVAILHLSPDNAVDTLLTELRGHHTSWNEIASESFGDDAASFGEAIKRLEARNGEFDTVLLVTHGRQDKVPIGEVEFRARTAKVGDVVRSNWYLIAEELDPIIGDGVALVTTVCFSSQEEFREAMLRRLPAYSIAGIGTLGVANAVASTLAFFRTSQAFDIEELGQAHEAIVEAVGDASSGQMAAWIPGDSTAA